MNRLMSCNKRSLKDGGRRARKDEKKGRRPPLLVGEDEKIPTDNSSVGSTLTLAEVEPGTHFEISFRPNGQKGDPPIFLKIKNIEVEDGSVHNCTNLQNQKSTWLPLAMTVVIVEPVSH